MCCGKCISISIYLSIYLSIYIYIYRYRDVLVQVAAKQRVIDALQAQLPTHRRDYGDDRAVLQDQAYVCVCMCSPYMSSLYGLICISCMSSYIYISCVSSYICLVCPHIYILYVLIYISSMSSYIYIVCPHIYIRAVVVDQTKASCVSSLYVLLVCLFDLSSFCRWWWTRPRQH